MTSAPPGLFRSAVQSRVTSPSHGHALMLQQPVRAWLASAFTAIAAGLLVMLFGASYTRQVNVSGVLLPETGLIRVTANQAGVVAELFAIEGQSVRPASRCCEW